MKKILSIIIVVIIIVAGIMLLNKRGNSPLISNSDPVDLHVLATVPEGATAITDGSYNVWEGAFIDWAANKTVLTSWIDKGTVSLPAGTVTVSAGVPVAGTFEFDMNSIVTTNTGAGDDDSTTSKLSEHLKSADWFNTAIYPKATFVLTRAVPAGDAQSSFRYTLTGRLTFKDITQEVTFDAYVYDLMGKLMIAGSADVDRTLWDIRFGSSKFFQDLGDKVINDVFVVNFNIAMMKTQ